MKRRIFGLEHEYGIACTIRGRHEPASERENNCALRAIVAARGASDAFLENGARLYVDVGGHPEYATPECDDILDLVAHDKAGDRILEDLRIAAENRLRNEGKPWKLSLFKNNTDSVGNSYGCHENYLISRGTDFERLVRALIPFFVTRQIYAGAGKVLQKETDSRYCLSQRAEHIWNATAASTTRDRPIIDSRDQPLAGAEWFRRLHILVGDSNMSECATFLKVGTTDLLLRMIESGAPLPDIAVEFPDRAIREVSRDPSCTQRILLKDGRKLSAVEIQTEYYEYAARFLEHDVNDAVSMRILSEWGEALKALHAKEPERLEGKVDWVTKYLLMERYRAKHDLALSHPAIALMDLAYHDINPQRGLYALLERHEKTTRLVDNETIHRAVTEPPQTTRARLRGDFIRQAKAKQRAYTADWSNVRLRESDEPGLTLGDPFRAVDARVEHLISQM